MTLIDKALWFVNGHFAEPIALEDVANAAGVSRHHLAHAFGRTTGMSVMGYARGLRLSLAARELANGAPDILAVALEAGYGSHEAFTRAFRDQFGQTPEMVRAGRSLATLALLEPIAMDTSPASADIQQPRFVDGKPMLIAGLLDRYTFANMTGIPAQWQRLKPHIGHIPGEIAGVIYGVILAPTEAGFDYLCGAAVTGAGLLPDELDQVRVPAQRFAVFRHTDHVSQVPATFRRVMNHWLPAAQLEVADAPFLERYGPEFDAQTGNGGLEIWVPVKA